MNELNNIPEPLNFNPLKHHLGFIRSFTNKCSSLSEEEVKKDIIPRLRHIGSSVADIYTGNLKTGEISAEFMNLRNEEKILSEESFANWISQSGKEYRKCMLPDSSAWIIKYLDGNARYFHFFPGRKVSSTIRSRGNSLKTAILYNILYDKGDIMLTDLNSVRKMVSLSPLKDTGAASGIISLIRLLQSAG